MGATDPFYFKTFSLKQNSKVFRIGTDAVLLGCFTRVNAGERVLDIGCGSGVLPLMLAQKNRIIADAIDISKEAYLLARSNFSNYQGSSEINCACSDFSFWAETHKNHYSCIISNPPFFLNALQPEDEKKREAKHSSTEFLLSFFHACSEMLDDRGLLNLIFPFAEKEKWIAHAAEKKLLISRQLYVKPHADKAYHRVVAEFSKESYSPSVVTETLTLLEAGGSAPSKEYQSYVSFFLPGTVPED